MYITFITDKKGAAASEAASNDLLVTAEVKLAFLTVQKMLWANVVRPYEYGVHRCRFLFNRDKSSFCARLENINYSNFVSNIEERSYDVRYSKQMEA